MKPKRKRDTSKLPPLEYRLVHVNYLKRQKCRFNPSLQSFLDLPRVFQVNLKTKWDRHHPRLTMPDTVLSLPKPKKERRR